MFINKIGSSHLEAGANCQDFGFIKDNRKVVVDGCSESLYSDIGANLFCRFLQEGKTIEESFNKLIELFPDYRQMKEYLCFTILEVIEYPSTFKLNFAGDGFIIKESVDGIIEFEDLSNGTDFPEYYIYNYISPEHLNNYKNGVSMKSLSFSKSEYSNIGIVSDGARYIIDSPFEREFIELLKQKKESSIKRFINKNNGISLFSLIGYTAIPQDLIYIEMSTKFKDDITIAF